MGKLDGRRVAIVATDGFEESELFSPRAELEREGAITEVLSLHEGDIRAWREGDWGDEVHVDHLIADSVSEDYDALVLPGGVINADKLRQEPDVVRLVQEFFDAGKPIAAICHAPWVLIETGELDGRQLTSYPSLKTDLVNAGADWVDAQVIEDENLITSRRSGDLPFFNARIIEAFKTPAPPPDAAFEVEELIATTEAPMPASFSPPRGGARRSPPVARASGPGRHHSGRAMARRTRKPRTGGRKPR